ncbi:MAG: symmetrical bis(5'-nucleosyl)-tetraphosphatase [Sulfurovaceae bacterium]|nr:symmetrical bis(5'-nucleosyl)-tetraphosphatase [Sulfurovaceae bacterium]
MIWAIGDLQGCYKPFMKLLKKIDFDPDRDKLWLVGDLVNRGKGSLEVLEYVYEHQKSIQIVLGNHDISLIAAYYGIKTANPTIEPILNSPRAKELTDWLRNQPFLYVDNELGYCMSHAGISPLFDLKTASKYARSLEKKLASDDAARWLKDILKKTTNYLNYGTTDKEKETFAFSSFLHMRYCFDDGSIETSEKGTPTQNLENKGLKPWFLYPGRKSIEQKIIFGHWSALGFYEDDNVLAIDTGCVWNGKLTAVRLDDRAIKPYAVECNN